MDIHLGWAKLTYKAVASDLTLVDIKRFRLMVLPTKEEYDSKMFRQYVDRSRKPTFVRQDDRFETSQRVGNHP